MAPASSQRVPSTGAQFVRPDPTQSWIAAAPRSVPVSHNPPATNAPSTTSAAISCRPDPGSLPSLNTPPLIACAPPHQVDTAVSA